MSNELSYDRKGSVVTLKGAIAAFFVLAVAVVVIFGVLSGGGGTTKASAEVVNGGGNVPVACAKTVHYDAYEAPAGTNDFGPNETFASVDDARASFNDKMCHDPLFAAIHAEARKLGANVKNIDASATMALARKYVANRALWAADVKTFNQDVVTMTLANYNTPYETLGMKPGAHSSEMPKLVKASMKVTLGQSLDIKLKSGVTLHDRTICGLQLSVPEFAKQVPASTPTCVPSSGNNYCGQPVQRCTSGCTKSPGCQHCNSTPPSCNTCTTTSPCQCSTPPPPPPSSCTPCQPCSGPCIPLSSGSQEVPTPKQGAPGVPTGGNGPPNNGPGNSPTPTAPGGKPSGPTGSAVPTQPGGGGNNSSSVPPPPPPSGSDCGPLSATYCPGP